MSQSRGSVLRRLLNAPPLTFLMEVHSGVSARIAEEAGFEALWGSGLAMSAASGVRDNSELTWTQVLDAVEFIVDATTVPLLLDGDTGYGDFNTVRRLVRKLDAGQVAGVCLEDKLFPKSNSLIEGRGQPLATIEDFTAKIKAGKDAQQSDAFCLVARVEALIAGLGLDEALRRAEAYRRAGADAILIHSRSNRPTEVLAFKAACQLDCPVIIVPTTYASTPTEVFEAADFSAVIWANHLLRASIAAMQQAARTVATRRSVAEIEDRIASLAEVFRLQGMSELEAAERRYLPPKARQVRAVLLAATRGVELGALTESRPKALVPIAGKPVLERIIEVLRGAGVGAVTVVRGFQKQLLSFPGVDVVDNDDFATTQEVFSLWRAFGDVRGRLLVGYGDVICQKAIPVALLEYDADFCIAVDPSRDRAADRARYTDYVTCAQRYARDAFDRPTTLRAIGPDLNADDVHGEWLGLLALSEAGTERLRSLLEHLSTTSGFAQMRMAQLLGHLMADGTSIDVVYTKGHWFDIDELVDVIDAAGFEGLP